MGIAALQHILHHKNGEYSAVLSQIVFYSTMEEGLFLFYLFKLAILSLCFKIILRHCFQSIQKKNHTLVKSILHHLFKKYTFKTERL